MENKEFLGNLCPTCNSFMFKLSWWRWRIGRVPFKAYLNYFWTGFSLYFRMVCSCSDQLQVIPKRSQKWSMEFWKCSVFSACLGQLELGKSASGLNQMRGNSVRETDNVPETLLFCIRTCIMFTSGNDQWVGMQMDRRKYIGEPHPCFRRICLQKIPLKEKKKRRPFQDDSPPPFLKNTSFHVEKSLCFRKIQSTGTTKIFQQN